MNYSDEQPPSILRTTLLFLIILLALLLGSYKYVNNYIYCDNILIQAKETILPSTYECTRTHFNNTKTITYKTIKLNLNTVLFV